MCYQNIQTLLGTGMGMNVTAHRSLTEARTIAPGPQGQCVLNLWRYLRTWCDMACLSRLPPLYLSLSEHLSRSPSLLDSYMFGSSDMPGLPNQ